MFKSFLKYVLLFGLVLLFIPHCHLFKCKVKPQLPEIKIVSTIKIPGIHIRGIAIAEDKNHLWIVNPKEMKLQKINLKKKETVDSLKTKVENPQGLAWDGKHFWIADDKTKMVHRIESSSGKIIQSLEVPIYVKKEAVVLEAAAWDGKYLWVAYSAGWSSRIHRMDVKTGEVVQSMFANCIPRALASDGKYLWVVSYNKGKFKGVVSRRTIMDDSGKMNLSRTFLFRTPGKEPVGITIDDRYCWIADRDTKLLYKIAMPPK